MSQARMSRKRHREALGYTGKQGWRVRKRGDGLQDEAQVIRMGYI